MDRFRHTQMQLVIKRTVVTTIIGIQITHKIIKQSITFGLINVIHAHQAGKHQLKQKQVYWLTVIM